LQGKIAFEEHFALPETLPQLAPFTADMANRDDFNRQVLDLGNERLEGMDANGIDFALLSLNGSGVQGLFDTQEAIALARKANDRMAEAMALHPARYGALAALPLQDAKAASDELIRCVRELGFSGAMVNGFTHRGAPDSALYYDLVEYREFWATVSELDVPIYLHPRLPLRSREPIYDGHPWLMSAPWGFGVETSIHALRLCGSGIFDEFPNLRIVLGHLGETIPYGLERLEERMTFSPRGWRGKTPIGEVFRRNFHITTSGNFSSAPMRCAVEVMGSDHVLFSTDYPFETMTDAADWFATTDAITSEERRKIGRSNAIRLFKLDLPD
jgi:2,3-dihydroxybenzoate decarboxylase